MFIGTITRNITTKVTVTSENARIPTRKVLGDVTMVVVEVRLATHTMQ